MNITVKESSKTLYGVLPIHNDNDLFSDFLQFNLKRIEDLGIKFSFNTSHAVGEEVFKLDGVTWVTCEVPEESLEVLANRSVEGDAGRTAFAEGLQDAAKRYLAENES